MRGQAGNVVHFFGVRGSMPVSDSRHVEFGGNTSCAALLTREGTLAVFDAGTGLYKLGGLLQNGALKPSRIALFLTHPHYDHVEGLKMFGPARAPLKDVAWESPIAVFATRASFEKPKAFANYLREPFFPVKFSQLKGLGRTRYVDAGEDFAWHDLRVRTAPLLHTSPTLAYRVDAGGESLVYALDTDHPAKGVHDPLVDLARGANLLVYDGHLTPDEHADPRYAGFGHSTFAAAADAAKAAGVKALAVTHHHPNRADADLRTLEGLLHRRFRASVFAREDMALPLANVAEALHSFHAGYAAVRKDFADLHPMLAGLRNRHFKLA